MSAPAPFASIAPQPSPHLTAEQIQQLQSARLRAKRINRAVKVAKFDGWTIAVFAALTFVGGFWGAIGFVLGIALGVIAFVELKYADRLQQFDLAAPRVLGMNQLALASLLIIYAGWQLLFPSNLAPELAGSAGDLKSLGIDLEEMNKLLNNVIYVGLILVAIVAQGSLALFYFRRQKMVRDYVRETPEWIRQIQSHGFTT